MWYRQASRNVYSALQKGLHLAEGIAGGVATAKGIYDAGSALLGAARGAYQVAGPVLAMI